VNAAIETSHLTKVFGSTRALDDVDLRVDEGSVFGFLGPNGAGKTTMLRLLTGLAHPTSGSARILGQDVVSAGNAVRSNMGFLPDVPGFYEWMTGEEFLRFSAGLFGLRGRELNQRLELLLGLAGLEGVRTRVGGYSRGMKQRLGVAQALVNAPRLLLLDEPTGALDPIGRKDVLEMIASLRGRTTVFFSTHILGDVERVCDTVAILNAGRVVAQGPIDDLRSRYGQQKVIVEVTEGAEGLAADLQAAPWADRVVYGGDGTVEVNVKDLDEARRRIPALVAARNLGLSRLEAGEMGLEEVFVELVGKVGR
jgi:ABC-2 type transport system ATP-binding protein